MPSRKAAARVEIANTIEPVQDSRIYIEKINAPFYTETAERQPNTAPACSSRSNAAGS